MNEVHFISIKSNLRNQSRLFGGGYLPWILAYEIFTDWILKKKS